MVNRRGKMANRRENVKKFRVEGKSQIADSAGEITNRIMVRVKGRNHRKVERWIDCHMEPVPDIGDIILIEKQSPYRFVGFAGDEENHAD